MRVQKLLLLFIIIIIIIIIIINPKLQQSLTAKGHLHDGDHWRHLTTTTRIHFVSPFLLKFRNPSEV